MKFSKLNKQSGAVLAFCLVMLLLLTLSGTRLIQQNKQQLEMANSMRQATQQFANAEGLLAEAKNVINDNGDNNPLNNPHLDPSGTAINNSAHQCEPTASFKQNVLLAGTTLFDSIPLLAGKVTVLEVRCKSETGTEQVCSSYETGALKCKPKSGDVDCAGKVIDDIAIAKFNSISDICYQNYDPQGSDDNTTCNVEQPPTWCITPNQNCPKEIYTIQVISTDANGTTRKIVSDHVVGCG